MGTSSYNGLQFALHQQETHGVQFDAYYTFAKSLDLGSDAERAGPTSTTNGGYFSQIINVYNPRGNRGPSDYDVRHAITVNALGALPFGRGRLIASGVNRLADAFHRRLESDRPDSLDKRTAFRISRRPGVEYRLGRPKLERGHHRNSIRAGTSTTAAASPTPSRASHSAINNIRPPYASETGERNFYRGDGYFSIDTGVSKIFSITEKKQVKFAWEIFNTTNSVRFDPASVSNNPFGNPGSYGRYTALLTQGRRMQGSLRFSF